jgi:hypothetical protein
MLWQVLAALIGIALMAAPDVAGLPQATGTLVNVLAPIAAAFAIIATSEVTRGLRYLSSAAAGLMAVSVPFLGGPIASLALVAGAAVVMALVALGGRRTSGSFGGGWRALR